MYSICVGELVRSIYVFSPITCMDYYDNKIVIGTGVCVRACVHAYVHYCMCDSVCVSVSVPIKWLCGFEYGSLLVLV